MSVVWAGSDEPMIEPGEDTVELVDEILAESD